MGALETAVGGGLALDQLALEGLLAMRADDIVFLGHEVKLAEGSRASEPDGRTLKT
jgi:hypothetical protein